MGQQRSYLLYVTRSHDCAKPTPVVISMHGAAAWPAQHMILSRWNGLAESQGSIVVYRSGSSVPKIRHVDRGAGLMRDVRFISALIDTLEAAYNVDATRIYANGISNGGGLAFVLSCTLSERIAVALSVDMSARRPGLTDSHDARLGAPVDVGFLPSLEQALGTIACIPAGPERRQKMMPNESGIDWIFFVSINPLSDV